MNRLSVVDSILLLEKVRRDSLEQQFLTETVTYNLWKNAGSKIMEAELTADQIEQLFQTVQQTATAGGDNRTVIGKGKDIASAVSNAVGGAWKDLKDKIYNSGPMTNFAAAYDKQAEKLKQATGGDEGVFKYIKKYREFAEKHPIIQSFVYAALIAAAGITGAGAGGAIALGLFKLTDQLLQGKDVRSAIYQGAKTGALAYGASKLGDLIKGNQSGASADSVGRGVESYSHKLGDVNEYGGEIVGFDNSMNPVWDYSNQTAAQRAAMRAATGEGNLKRFWFDRPDELAAQDAAAAARGAGNSRLADF